jgi:glyoxylase-like metal-dependent hydrolase (beta-lactamase superfamily II)
MSSIKLPIATSWFQKETVGDGITLITEPHVDILERANIWHIKGSKRDLLIDSGMGVVSLRNAFPELFEGRETIALATHTHLDHIGSIHEFEHRWVHPIEAENLKNPQGGTLVSEEMDLGMRKLFEAAGYPPLGHYLIHALPYADYIPEHYTLKGANPTKLVEEGDIVDLGNRQYIVVFTPGHSPGSISLFEEETGYLFAGDIIYDGPLLYAGPGMNVADYVESFEKLRRLCPKCIYAGHDPIFDNTRMNEIIEGYMLRWRNEGLFDKSAE